MAELRTDWHKSSYSDQGSCVEVAELTDGRVAVRDTKSHGLGPVLTFPPRAWDTFLNWT